MITPNDLSISKKKIAPKMIIKMSKATKNPLTKEIKAICGKICQKKKIKTATKRKVTKEVQKRDIFFHKRRDKNKKKGAIDNKVGK